MQLIIFCWVDPIIFSSSKEEKSVASAVCFINLIAVTVKTQMSKNIYANPCLLEVSCVGWGILLYEDFALSLKKRSIGVTLILWFTILDTFGGPLTTINALYFLLHVCAISQLNCTQLNYYCNWPCCILFNAPSLLYNSDNISGKMI